MLKTIAVTLMFVGLQKGSATTSSQRDMSNTVDSSAHLPGFVYSRSRIPKISLSANQGTFQNYQTIHNTTAWEFKTKNNVSQISITITLPNTLALYSDTHAAVGILRKDGSTIATLDRSTYKLTLSTKGNSTACTLDLDLEVSCVDMDLNLRDLGLVGLLIRLTLGAVNEIKQSVATSLRGALPNLLTDWVGQSLKNKVDLGTLCKDLLASNVTHYPQPRFD